MRYLPTIFLALLAIVLGGLALVHTGESYRASIFGVPSVKPGNHLFSVKELNKVRQITLTNTEGAEATFKVSGNYWLAETPWKDRADPLFIRALFNYTTGLVVRDTIPRKHRNLQKFGLEKGSVRITMKDAEGETVCDYRLGRQAAWHVPTEDGKSTLTTNFIRLMDKKLKHTIYLCSTDTGQIQSLFANNFARFRDHHPFYFSSQYLDRARIQNNEGEVVISRDSLRSTWSITKPLKLQVDPNALSNFFINLGKLTAVKVDDRANVTLPTAEDNSTHSREIAIHSIGVDEDFVLKVYPPAQENDTEALATISNRPDTVFFLPITSSDPRMVALDQFQTGVNDLRSKTMTHLNGPQIEMIVIRPAGRMPTLLKRTKRTTWRVVREKGAEKANESAVINLMTAVTRDKISKFVTDACGNTAKDLAPYGLDTPFLQLGFIGFNHKAKIALAFGRGPKTKTGRKIYARVIGKPNIWEIAPETIAKIAINPWQWRTANVWHIPKIDIKHIEIEQKGKPIVGLEYAFFSERWKATRHTGDAEPTDATADLNPHRANTLLGELESLSTTQWLGPFSPQAAKALQSPDIIIRIRIQRTDDEGNETDPITKTLKIASTSGKLIYFAKVETSPASAADDGEENYFLLSPETVNQLTVNLFQ